jgi:hypothetical protein
MQKTFIIERPVPTPYDGLVLVKVFQEFLHTVEAGQIHLNVSKVFTLNDIVEAHRDMESNKGLVRL